MENIKNLETSSEDEENRDIPGITGETMLVSSESQISEFSHSLEEFYNDMQSADEKGNCGASDDDLESADSELLTSLKNISFIADDDEETHKIECNEEEANSSWLNKEKHVFILSESGKPVYTRHGKEDRFVTLFGLMQALVSFVADGDDAIHSIQAGRYKFVFLIRSPLILVAISSGNVSVPQLTLQLTYVHSQIVSVLTASALTRIFEKRRNYDFRNMLGGTERLLDNLLNSLEEDVCFLLGAVQCLPLSISIREAITQTIIQYCSKIKNLVFALLICNNQLISLVRLKKFLIHPADLHLIFNLVNSTESLKTCENWMPVCLPKFDPKGYLYGHVSYLADDCEACLILLTVDREQFFILSEAKQKIVERLRRQHYLEKINVAIKTCSYDVHLLVCPELSHFLYKSRSTGQFTHPSYSYPYKSDENRSRLLCLYQVLHHRIHSVSPPLKMVYHVTNVETLVGWATKEFELYAVLDPLVTRPNAVTIVNKILQWVKNEESRLFILNSPTF